MWNMGLLFLIYYCVSIYSAKGDSKESLPLDVGSLAEDAGDAESNGLDNTEANVLPDTTPIPEVSSLQPRLFIIVSFNLFG